MKAKLKDVKLTEYVIKGKKYWAAEHPKYIGYWPTTCGNVISTNSSYNGQGKSKRASSVPKLLVPQANKKNGYLRVSICTKEGRFEQLVHRLIAQTYLEAPDDDLRDWDIPRPREDVNHIDGNPRNNKLANLEWNSRKENLDHNKLLKAIKEEVKGKGTATD
jgi:hypothetical protein